MSSRKQASENILSEAFLSQTFWRNYACEPLCFSKQDGFLEQYKPWLFGLENETSAIILLSETHATTLYVILKTYFLLFTFRRRFTCLVFLAQHVCVVCLVTP